MAQETESGTTQTPAGGFHPFKPVLAEDDTFTNQETNLIRPPTDAIITIRVIKSFSYRSMKALVLRNVDLTTTTIEQLEEKVREQVKTQPSFKAFRTYAAQLDTMKIYTRAHGSKTTNLIINLDKPEWVLDQGKQRTLSSLGLENEAELSFFNNSEYEAFLADPETKW